MIARFQHILLPVDFTPKNEAAVDVTLEMAVQHDARVSLLHVIESVDLPDDDELTAFYSALERRARGELAKMAARFSEPQVPTSQAVCRGKRAHEIVRFASDNSVDLIVMSSHAVDPQRPVHSLSTISYQVSLMCACPVLLVK